MTDVLVACLICMSEGEPAHAHALAVHRSQLTICVGSSRKESRGMRARENTRSSIWSTTLFSPGQIQPCAEVHRHSLTGLLLQAREEERTVLEERLLVLPSFTSPACEGDISFLRLASPTTSTVQQQILIKRKNGPQFGTDLLLAVTRSQRGERHVVER